MKSGMKMKPAIVVFLLCCIWHVWANPPTGVRPTEFPDISTLRDSTLLFTQDSNTHASYKFTLDKLKKFTNKNIQLDSSLVNHPVNCAPPAQVLHGGQLFFGNIFSSFGMGGSACDATALPGAS